MLSCNSKNSRLHSTLTIYAISIRTIDYYLPTQVDSIRPDPTELTRLRPIPLDAEPVTLSISKESLHCRIQRLHTVHTLIFHSYLSSLFHPSCPPKPNNI